MSKTVAQLLEAKRIKDAKKHSNLYFVISQNGGWADIVIREPNNTHFKIIGTFRSSDHLPYIINEILFGKEKTWFIEQFDFDKSHGKLDWEFSLRADNYRRFAGNIHARTIEDFETIMNFEKFVDTTDRSDKIKWG